MRVFIPHKTDRLDLTPLEKMGDTVYMLEESQVNPFLDRIMGLIDRVFDENDFNPEQDAIALVGNAAIQALVLAVAMAKYGHVNVQIWNANARAYRMRTFQISPGNANV